MLQEAWGPIYKGNVPDTRHTSHITHFLDTYSEHIYTSPEFTLGDLDWHHLKHTCINSPKRSNALDHWAPADLTLLSDLA